MRPPGPQRRRFPRLPRRRGLRPRERRGRSGGIGRRRRAARTTCCAARPCASKVSRRVRAGPGARLALPRRLASAVARHRAERIVQDPAVHFGPRSESAGAIKGRVSGIAKVRAVGHSSRGLSEWVRGLSVRIRVLSVRIRDLSVRIRGRNGWIRGLIASARHGTALEPVMPTEAIGSGKEAAGHFASAVRTARSVRSGARTGGRAEVGRVRNLEGRTIGPARRGPKASNREETGRQSPASVPARDREAGLRAAAPAGRAQDGRRANRDPSVHLKSERSGAWGAINIREGDDRCPMELSAPAMEQW